MDDTNDLINRVRRELRVQGVQMNSDAERVAIAITRALRDMPLGDLKRQGQDQSIGEHAGRTRTDR